MSTSWNYLIAFAFGYFGATLFTTIELKIRRHHAKAAAAILSTARESDLRCMAIIHDLRDREGWMVELICDNPDFEGPGCIVGVFGEWPVDTVDERASHPVMAAQPEGTEVWGTRKFSGDTLLLCLQSARAARNGRDERARIRGGAPV